MTTHRLTYHGPAALALRTATALADADGVELTSSEAPQRRGPDGGNVALALTVKASSEALAAALAQVRDNLPAGAQVTLDDADSS
jgi:hypothetical protein